MLVCVKDRTCLRMAIPAYCFSMFGSIFGALFCLFTKKLILECDCIWQSMRVSMRSLKYEYISSYGQRRNIILKTAHWYGLNFLYVFIRTENLNLKFSENLADLTFLREKVSTFAESKWYVYTLWLLITLCNMPKGLLT